MAESFTTTNRYFDNKHYPRGFSRHGDFTIKEAQLLERHGYAFNELDLGKREPVTEEEKLFVAVCRGEREPVT
ncbi:TPA: macrodomain Ori organization protein MaoP, partial [Salmonella enterica]|nr:macrodomain Ori organization protein MaoP [Escherichia coli]